MVNLQRVLERVVVQSLAKHFVVLVVGRAADVFLKSDLVYYLVKVLSKLGRKW